ncbi:MAG: hypothetical protein H6609_09430 [Ignavibacteriales bacterium]|nr:hypothetical protein [Ignavibacteriales bacterium]
MKYYHGNSINPNVGIFMSFKLYADLILESELSYLHKGSRKTENIYFSATSNPYKDYFKTSVTYDTTLRYMEVSVNLKTNAQFYK